MKRSTKSAAVTQVDFSDFSGGLNLLAAPENIADNELSECRNMTYSTAPGRLRTRHGWGAATGSFASDVDGMKWWNGALVVAAGQKLYKLAGGNTTLLGNLTGTSRPCWCEYGADLYVATGGKLQKLTEAFVLSVVVDSKALTVGIYAKFGRLWCWCADSDYRYGSASGDPSVWTIPGNAAASDPVEQQIGYKVGSGPITKLIPMLNDIVAFKGDVVLHIVEESGSSVTGVYEVCRGEELANGESAVNIGGELFYLDRSRGVRRLTGTNSYGDMLPADALEKINPYLRSRIDRDRCRLWHLKARKMLIVGLGETELFPAYYDYGIDNMPVLRWTFDGEVRDIAEPDRERLYIAVGGNIYDMTKDVNVDCLVKPRMLSNCSAILLKRMSVRMDSPVDIPNIQPIKVMCGDKEYLRVQFGSLDSNDVYQNEESVAGNEYDVYTGVTRRKDFTKHNLYRGNTMEISVKNDGGGPFILSKLTAEITAVGVIG